MRNAFRLRHSLESFCVLLSVALLGVVGHEFLIGKHFIRPTLLLAVPVFLGNVALYGYRGHAWAKYTAFWIGVITSAHWFFALFHAQALRRVLGEAFVPTVLVLLLLSVYLTMQYKRQNALSIDPGPNAV